MARITDPQKIENVKRAAMETIAEHGYKGASIASIAAGAEVSVGYLYRYYVSKDDLVHDLANIYFGDMLFQFFSSIEKYEQVHDFFYNIVHSVFEIAKSDPVRIKFAATLGWDADPDNNAFGNMKEEMDKIISKVINIGKATGEFNPKVNKEEIMLLIVTIPLKYAVNQLKKENYTEKLSDEHAHRIAEMCMKALA